MAAVELAIGRGLGVRADMCRQFSAVVIFTYIRSFFSAPCASSFKDSDAAAAAAIIIIVVVVINSNNTVCVLHI